jgi:hypothetical protein
MPHKKRSIEHRTAYRVSALYPVNNNDPYMKGLCYSAIEEALADARDLLETGVNCKLEVLTWKFKAGD